MADGVVELRAFEQQALRGRQTLQLQLHFGRVGQGDLALFDFHGQPVAGALVDQLLQTPHFVLLTRIAAHVGQLYPDLLGVGQVDRVPGRQVEIIAGRHFAIVMQPAAIAEQRHDRRQAQVFIEVRATDVHAARGEDVVTPLGFFGPRGRQAHQRKVGSTAADVGDQHQLFAVDLRLVVEGGGNRLELEGDVLEAHGTGHVGQRVLRQLVGLRIVVDKENGTTEHGRREFAAGRLLGAAFHFANELGQQHAKWQGAATHFRLAIDETGAQQAFQRAHQTPLVTGQITGQRRAAKTDFLVFRIEEDDGR